MLSTADWICRGALRRSEGTAGVLWIASLIVTTCLCSAHLAVITDSGTNVVQEVISSDCTTLLFPTSHPTAFLLPHRILITTQSSPLYPPWPAFRLIMSISDNLSSQPGAEASHIPTHLIRDVFIPVYSPHIKTSSSSPSACLHPLLLPGYSGLPEWTDFSCYIKDKPGFMGRDLENPPGERWPCVRRTRCAHVCTQGNTGVEWLDEREIFTWRGAKKLPQRSEQFMLWKGEIRFLIHS